MLSVAATIVLAVFGHWANVWSEKRREAKTRHLDRIDTQLAEFYGPLRALLARSKVAFNTVIETHWERHYTMPRKRFTESSDSAADAPPRRTVSFDDDEASHHYDASFDARTAKRA